MNWLSLGTDLMKWLILAVKVFVGAVLLMLLYVVFNFMFGFKSSEFGRVALTSSAESDLTVTSFAQVDLLHLKNRREEITIPSEQTADNFERVIDERFENARAFCLHSYEVAFGYPSLSEERARLETDEEAGTAPVPEPSIVAVNVLRTENAPDSSTLWCQRKNLKQWRDPSLKDQLLYALEHDGVLADHVNHGQMLLAATLDLSNPACGPSRAKDSGDTPEGECLTSQLTSYLNSRASESSTALESLEDDQLQPVLDEFDALAPGTDALEVEFDVTSPVPGGPEAEEKQDKLRTLALSIQSFEADAMNLRRAIEQDRRAANMGADVAGIVLTFSTTLGVSEERKRFLGLWKSKRFYLQRDIARVYYGSRISPSSVRTHRAWFGPDRVEIVLPRPSIIAMDRYSSFVVARNKIDGKSRSNQSLANYLNQQIMMHLDRGINRFHARAISIAENVMVFRVPEYFGLEGVEYDVSFTGERSYEPNLEFIAGVLDLATSETEEPSE